MRLFYLLASIVLALATSACVLIDVQSGIRPDDEFLSRRWKGIATVFGLLVIALAPFLLWILVADEGAKLLLEKTGTRRS